MLRSLINFAVILSPGFGSCLLYALPLHDAAQAGDVAAAVAVLMDDPSEINVKDGHGSTPLAMAAQEGHLEMVSFLLEKGAAINTKANYRGAPLSTTAFYSNPAVVKLLRAKSPVGVSGATPLYIAAQEGHFEVVALLLEKGAAVEAEADDGATPLSSAAFNGRAEVVHLLLEKDAVVDTKDNNGVTPLARAAQQGHLEVVRLLLEKGAVVDAKDSNSVTPLARAAQQRHLEVVRLLLKKGAVVDAKDIDGVTPLARAAQNWGGLLDGRREIVKLLLANGANPNTVGFAPDAHGKTALQVAEEQAQGYKEIAEALREACASQKLLCTPARAR